MLVKDIIKKVKRIEFITKKRMKTDLSGQYRSIFKNNGVIFSEIREYTFGDDIRRIDWNKTALFNTPFVKVLEKERELSIILLIDISTSMNYGSKSVIKKNFVAEICASIGFSSLDQNHKISAILFSDKIYKVIPSQKNKKHLLNIISQILSSDFVPSKTDLKKTLEYCINTFKKKSILFLFSDFHDDFDTNILKVISKKHQLIGLKISDEKDFEIPNIGFAEFEDTETKEKIWIDTSNASLRYSYQEARKERLNQVKKDFEKTNNHFIHLNTNEDYIKKLLHHFHHHQL